MRNTSADILSACTLLPIARLVGRNAFPHSEVEAKARDFFRHIVRESGVVQIPVEEAVDKAVADFLDAFKRTHIRQLKDPGTGLSLVGYLDHLDRSQVEEVIVRRSLAA